MTIDLIAYYAKSVAGFVSAIAVALLTIYGPETQVGHWLTIAVAVAGAIAVYSVPNRQVAGASLNDLDFEPTGAEDEDIEFANDEPDHEPVDLDNEPGEHRRED